MGAIPQPDGTGVTTVHGRLALRSLLLGLVTREEDGGLRLGTAVGEWQSGQRWVDMEALLAGLSQCDAEAALLSEAADEEWRRLPAPAVAGYHALLRWFQTAVLEGDRGELQEWAWHCLEDALLAERRETTLRLQAAGRCWFYWAIEMVERIGQPGDWFSTASGGWRHLLRE